MKVEVVVDSIDGYSEQSVRDRVSNHIRYPEGGNELVLGRQYEVLGIQLRGRHQWYLICLEGDDYPTPSPAESFLVVDSVLPDDWTLAEPWSNRSRNLRYIVPRSWTSMDNFYELLVEGDPSARKVFLQTSGVGGDS